MPEAHLSKAQALAFRILVRENKDSITQKVQENDTEGYMVGETKEPMFIVYDTHISRPGEADLAYPSELKKKLLESGVIFEKNDKTSDINIEKLDVSP
ncbi:MAG: hypothetical protein AAB675_03855 [Patescibacteria group bacterium]